MAHASSNWIVIVCLVIFLAVGIIGGYAGYTSNGINLITENATDIGTIQSKPNWMWNLIPAPVMLMEAALRYFAAGTGTWATVAKGLFFLENLVTFRVADIPWWLSAVFDLMVLILGMAVARIIAGALGGGS